MRLLARPALLVVGALCGLAATAGPAAAAVSVTQTGGTLTVTGNGAADVVRIFKEDPFDAGNRHFFVARDGGGLTLDPAVTACGTTATPGTVKCGWQDLTALTVKLGDGDDRVIGGSPAAGVAGLLDGQGGDDTYSLNADSTGPDRFADSGTGGHDTLDLAPVSGSGYWMRAGDGTANDGRWNGVATGPNGAAVPDDPPTEGDDVTSSLEGFVGTSARDYLEVLGTGSQSMQGGSGFDDLRGQSGNDTLDGQGGDDRVEGGSQDDHIIGGPGKDRLFGDYESNTQTGNDRVEAADGTADAVIDCGPGTDTLTRDDGDPAAIGCEAAPATAPANTQRPVLSGTARVGQELAVTTGTWSGTQPITYTYRWMNCVDAPNPYADCRVSRQATTTATYRLQDADVGRLMLAVVIATNSRGSAESTPASFSGKVEPGSTPPVNAGRPGLTGTARVGGELQVTTGTWTGTVPMTFMVRWQNCVDAPNPFVDCRTSRDFSADRTYRPVAADVGRRILAVVRATNAAGSAEATPASFSGVVEPGSTPPVGTARPELTGTARVGSELQVTTGTWSGTQPMGFEVRWQNCVDAPNPFVDCRTSRDFSADRTYRPVAADVGRRMLAVVRATNAAGSAEATPASFSGVVLRAPLPGPLGTSIEVTQGVQTATNQIPLVAGRSTSVRVRVLPVGEPVTGRLHVLDGTRAITPAAGVAPSQPAFTPPTAFDRGVETTTLNFDLPAPTGIGASTALTFRVDLTMAGVAESISAGPLRAVVTRPPRIFYVPITYTPGKLGAPSAAFMQAGVGDAFVRAIFPVDDSDAGLYQAAPIPAMTFAGDRNKDGVLQAGEGAALLDKLKDARALMVKDDTALGSDTMLHGWIAGNPTDHNGQARLNDTIGYNNTDPARGQRTFAHELAHNFGYDHLDAATPASRLTDVGWDVGNRLSSNPATNGVAERVKPLARCDIMCAGLSTKDAWIHTDKYLQLMSRWSGGASAAAATGAASRDALVIQGSVKGGDVVLDPVFRYPWRDTRTPPATDGRYQLELRTESGRTIKVPFTPTETADVPGDSKAAAGFEVVVATKEDLASLKATTRPRRGKKARTLDVERALDDDPRLRVTAPRAGKALGARTTVRWRGRSDDALEHQVAFSPDGGKSFVPVGVELKGSSFTFDSTSLPKTAPGKGVLRVFASDGLDSTYADVRGLSAPRARFGTW